MSSLSAATVTMSPCSGSFFRYLTRSLRKPCHSSLSRPSSTGIVYLPAVSRMMACSKNHQSQFRVPEIPEVLVTSAKGEDSLALPIEVVFPDPLSPMTRYQGRTYSGLPCLRRWERRSASTASFHRLWRTFNSSRSVPVAAFRRASSCAMTSWTKRCSRRRSRILRRNSAPTARPARTRARKIPTHHGQSRIRTTPKATSRARKTAATRRTTFRSVRRCSRI